jgi:hypothetical protein
VISAVSGSSRGWQLRCGHSDCELVRSNERLRIAGCVIRAGVHQERERLGQAAGMTAEASR